MHNEDPSKPCGMCGDYGHVAATCHQIWRYYRPVQPDEMEMCGDIERYCYNCAVVGHLGDDCPRPRPFYIQAGRTGVVVSAFGEGNVPEWAKKAKQNNARRINKAQTILEEEDDDGWFTNQHREPPKPTRKIGGIKLNSNAMKREAMANVAEARRNNDRRPNELPPPTRRPPSRDRSPERPGRNGSSSIDSYRPNYRRNRPPKDNSREGGDWESKVDQWRRNREVDRWTPTGSHLR